MANTPTREHREAAIAVCEGGPARCCKAWAEFETSPESHVRYARIAQAICDAEQRGFERGLANRDERCLQSDMQRIREKLALERGREAERAEVVRYLDASNVVSASYLAAHIEAGKHLAKEE